jgi:hypothetical protein
VIANIPSADVEFFRYEGGEWHKLKGHEGDHSDPYPWFPEGPVEGEVYCIAEKPWGPQVRSLFTVLPGYKMVGADSSGNQFRALCHYLGPEAEDYRREGIEGDIHTLHANILSEVVPDTKRGTAKPFFIKENVKLRELLGHPVSGQPAAKLRDISVFTTPCIPPYKRKHLGSNQGTSRFYTPIKLFELWARLCVSLSS